ncbi:unnamed protein product [Tenebrio molitor]|nr:unnamed protein product [Tenebrio molitor]
MQWLLNLNEIFTRFIKKFEIFSTAIHKKKSFHFVECQVPQRNLKSNELTRVSDYPELGSDIYFVILINESLPPNTHPIICFNCSINGNFC